MTMHLQARNGRTGGRVLSSEARTTFETYGVVVLKDFYDLERDIHPIQRQIHRMIALVAERHGVALPDVPFHPDTFDAGYGVLLEKNRRFASEVYDAVKMLPAFVRLVAHEKNESLLLDLDRDASVGIAHGGYGIRIDNPNEDRFRADWHQEYPAQLRSPEGIVFWSSLVRMEEALGPVQFAAGSHKDGLVPLHRVDKSRPESTGAYGFTLENRDERLARYPIVAPLTSPADLVVVHFKTLHASGHNKSDRSRWSMQFRYFDFAEPMGMKNGWPGGVASGIDFANIHPELVAKGS